MELGCPALPYQPFVYFVDEAGQEPAEGMSFDAESGVTVLALLRADDSFVFSEPVQYAVVTDFELQQNNVTFSDLHNGLFQGEQALTAFMQLHSWCQLKTGSFSQSGVTATHPCAHVMLMCRWWPFITKELLRT